MYHSMECLMDNDRFMPEFGSYDLSDVEFEIQSYRDDGETVRLVTHTDAEEAQRYHDRLLAELLKSESPSETAERVYPYCERKQAELLANLMDQE